ncbi:MAG: prepilin-type N-terminal cleavage/methylation domain-containing protein [Acidobacteria bacterium]|nr:prepilin-type N-terminal cleavage/methylation domain-containing protein [Acidobacteriota bacterium]
MKKQKGFSLIELLIVVAIILIIAAIAVPNLLRSRMAANEASAAGSLRTIATSNVTYSTTYGIGYAQDLVTLGPGAGGGAASDQADLIDATLAGGVKSGYDFTAAGAGDYTATDANTDTIFESFTAFAAPTQDDVTGKSVFCVDQSNVVYRDPAGVASTAGASDVGIACDNPDIAALVPL